MQQEQYIEFLAEDYYDIFSQLGHAIAGHNGPHGHRDTPVRNTAHYLIIYSYLYKKYEDKRYLELCRKFADYLCNEQAKSKSGAIQCMETDKFDHLNGLIGQAWIIEALLYYYDLTRDEKSLKAAKKIYCSQKYDWDLHLWRRIELDGTDIGPDKTYNHQVWFAACVARLSDFCNDLPIDNEIRDFLTKGAARDFRIYSSGLLYHNVALPDRAKRKKKRIKQALSLFAWLNPQKLDTKYIVKAYHIFDMYGFAILKERYSDLPLFTTDSFKKAVESAKDIEAYDRRNNVNNAIHKGRQFNVFGYSYNSPAFEYPYIAMVYGFENNTVFEEIYQTQRQLMYDEQTKMFSKNNPDGETWNARTYEIIRYLDRYC